MTYKEFKMWCNERACDGRWGFLTAKVCINAITKVNQSPFWKREKVWQRVNLEHRVVEDFIIPTNELIAEEKLKELG